MRLTKHSDYALRVLLYLGVTRGRSVSTEQISESFGISVHHLSKVVHKLGQLGLVTIKRGRGGGIELARPPEQIRLGEVVARTEPDFALVQCFEVGNHDCRLTGHCALVPPLQRAHEAFIAALDEYTLADALGTRREARYRKLLRIVD